MATQNLAAICENCGNLRSHHSKFDTHSLLVMAWKAGDFDLSPDPGASNAAYRAGSSPRDHSGSTRN
jgi:hypothetical protein